jgi:hypothetical protein
MAPLRLHVTPRGSGYIARADGSSVTAVGSSAAEAAENARLLAVRPGSAGELPLMLIVRLDEPGRSVFVMQPAQRPVSFERPWMDGDAASYAALSGGAWEALSSEQTC